jgi:hypothetical protein
MTENVKGFSRKGAKSAKAQRRVKYFGVPLRLCDLCAFA